MEGIVSTRLTIAISVLTVLGLSAGSRAYSCPSVCTCYVDGHGFRTANCTGVKFWSEYKFSKLIREIEVLNVEPDSDDHLMLWDDMFSSFTKLKHLNLSKCKINYLPKNVFKGLKKIYEINLSYNDLRHFDNSVFENIYTLHKLNLRGNPLQATYKPFISSPSLHDLDLGYCSMTVLQNEFFHGVKKVSRLHLDGNHLQTIKEHVLPRGITHLNLASNRIVNVPISTIFSLSQLKWINLSANPINCTCPLLNLQDRLSGRGIIVEDVRCAYPLEHENISWSKINENELCNKEIFRSRLHTKKSHNAKYINGQRKDNYFENEKYSPFEIFQGDDPGKSGDDDYGSIMSGDEYAEPKSDIQPDIDGNGNDQLTPLKRDEIKEKKDTDVEIHGSETTNHGKLEKQISSTEENKKNESTELPLTNEKEENKDYTPSERKDIAPHDGDSHDDVLADGAEENEGDTTAAPMTTDADFIINDPEINLKSNLDNLDEGLKREDEILPVSESPDNELTETDSTKNTDDEKTHINIFDENENKRDEDFSVAELEDENKNDTSKSNIEETKNIDDIEPLVIKKNVSDLDESINIKDHQNLNSGPTQKTEAENNKENIFSANDNNLFNQEQEGSVVSSSTTDIPVTSSTKIPVISNEIEGSGSDSIDVPDESSSASKMDETAKEVTPESTVIPSSEIPLIRIPDYDYELDRDGDEVSTENSLEVSLEVNKSSNTYDEVGPYIVLMCIICIICILLFIPIYKGLCRLNKNKGKPVPDVEANNGTELQDMKSLLPKTPVNDEKHNNKYPNEIPSPETVNLIKKDKTEDTQERNGLHDLNQNDNKNESVVKNGKTPEGSPPPVEITKAKLTVLLESIPRTPIFVQKRPTTVNNG